MDLRKLAMEAMGTFFLVLTITVATTWAAAAGNAMAAGILSILAPIAIGLVLTVLVYVGGNISGAHYNPAVSVAIYLRGKMPMADLLPYIGAQCAGGLAGALIGWVISHTAPVIEVAGFRATAGGKWGFIHGAMLVEFLFTFLLAYVVLTVATTKKHANNPYYGFCIGGTVMVGAIAAGPISGGAFNPAVGLSLSIVGLFKEAAAIQWFWVYLVFPVLGGACAALAFRFFHPDEIEPAFATPTKVAPAQEPLAQQPDANVTPRG